MTKNELMVEMAQMAAKSNEISKALAGKNEKLERENEELLKKNQELRKENEGLREQFSRFYGMNLPRNVSIEELRECFQNFIKKATEG